MRNLDIKPPCHWNFVYPAPLVRREDPSSCDGLSSVRVTSAQVAAPTFLKQPKKSQHTLALLAPEQLVHKDLFIPPPRSDVRSSAASDQALSTMGEAFTIGKLPRQESLSSTFSPYSKSQTRVRAVADVRHAVRPCDCIKTRVNSRKIGGSSMPLPPNARRLVLTTSDARSVRPKTD
jgi:hypothetical protein